MSSSYERTTPSVPFATDEDGATKDFKVISIAFEVINITLILATTWLLLCMITYGKKTKRLSWRGRESSRLERGAIYLWCICAVTSAFPRLALTEAVFHVPQLAGGENICEILIDIGNVSYFFNSYLIYFFLWRRQRTIYSHPSSRHFAGKWTNVVSYICLVGLTIISVVSTYFYIAPQTFARTSSGCIIDKVVRSNSVGDSIIACALVLAQVSLLTLFVYPLCKSGAVVDKQQHRVSTIATSPQRPPWSPSKRSSRLSRRGRFSSSVRSVIRGSKSANRVTRLIRRSLISASIAIAADVLTVISVTAAIPPTFSLSIAMTVYNASALIKEICILSTFNFYRKILLVFCGSISADSKTRASSTSTDAGNGRPRVEASSVSFPEVFTP